MKLPASEELDFHYLLGLMQPLHNVPDFCWLPELFSIIGHERLITLCKYAGGEAIKIPTLDQLSNSIDALQWFYDIYVKHTKAEEEIPQDLKSLVQSVKEVYDAGNNKS